MSNVISEDWPLSGGGGSFLGRSLSRRSGGLAQSEERYFDEPVTPALLIRRLSGLRVYLASNCNHTLTHTHTHTLTHTHTHAA